jgi:hypothetical protein
MSDLNRKVNVEIDVNGNTKDAQRSMDALNKKLEETKRKANELEETFGKMAQASGALAALGASVWVPAIAAAQKYSEAVGKTEKVSRQFIEAQKRREQATIDFGRKSAEALQPYNDALTDLLEKVSEVDPNLLRAGLAAGGALALLGAIGVLTATVGQFIAQSTLLIATLNTKAGFNVAGSGVAGVVGVGAGIAITRGIGRATGNEDAQDANLGDLAAFAGQGVVLGLVGTAVALKETAEVLNTVLSLVESIALYAEKTAVEFETDLNLFLIALEDGADLLVDTFNLMVLAFKKAALGIGIDSPLGDINLGEELGFNADEVNAAIAELAARETDYAERRQDALDREEQALNDINDAADGIAERNRERARDIDEAFDIEAITDAILNAFQMGGDEAEKAADEKEAIDAEAYAQGIDALEQYNEDLDAIDKAYKDNSLAQEKAFNEETLDLQEDFDDKRLKQLADFNEKADKEAADFGKTQLQEAQRLNKELDQMTRDYNRESAALNADFRRNQSEALGKFNQEEIKRIEDFGLKRQRADQDSRERELDAISRLDFAALYNERRSRNKQRREEKEDFDRETAQRRQNYDTQAREAQAAFVRQQAERRAQYELQVQESRLQFADEQRQRAEEFRARQQDARQQFNRQRQQEQDAFRQQLSDRQTAYQAQINQERSAYNVARAERQRAFNDQLAQLFAFGKYEANARAAHYEALRRQLDSYLRGVQGSPTQKPRNAGGRIITEYAEGGYKQGDGLAYLHNNERILKPSLTGAMEKAMGGRLTDQRIMNYVTNNNRASSPVVNINGSGLNEQQLEQVARRALVNALKEASA